MSQKVFYMIKKNDLGFIGSNGIASSNGLRKCCTAIVFCFLPFIYESSFAAPGQELSKIFCCKINNANKITHSASGTVISTPFFFWFLEKGQSLVDFGSELSGGDSFTVGSGKIFSKSMLKQGASKVDNDTTKNGTAEESQPIHTFLLGC